MNTIDLKTIQAKISSLDLKVQYYIFSALVLLMVAADFVFIMRFQLGAFTKQNAEIITIQQNLERAKNEVQRLDQFKSELDRMQSQMKETSLKIRLKSEVPLILEDISRVARDHNVKIEQVMPVKDKQEVLVSSEDGSYLSLLIMVQASSGYHSLGRFINKLERENILIGIEDLNISSSDKNTNVHSVQMRLKSVVFDQLKK